MQRPMSSSAQRLCQIIKKRPMRALQKQKDTPRLRARSRSMCKTAIHSTSH
jgi:hypothetical protein